MTSADNPVSEPLPGYKQVQPVVFCGIFPTDGSRYNDLKDALERLKLNDASLSYEPETSAALGFGFRCGFLGLLHMEIIQERLEREFDLDLITTAPSVEYDVYTTDGEMMPVSNPSNLPPVTSIDRIEEPVVRADIYTPPEFIYLSWSCVRTSAASSTICSISTKRAFVCTIPFRSTRLSTIFSTT